MAGKLVSAAVNVPEYSNCTIPTGMDVEVGVIPTYTDPLK
jgi:hypothetical protein